VNIAQYPITQYQYRSNPSTRPLIHLYRVLLCQRLVRICGEVRASPAETDEVMFLCTLCSKLKADPYLINFFIEVEQLSRTLIIIIILFAHE